jgi:uncharacterized membrane protein
MTLTTAVSGITTYLDGLLAGVFLASALVEQAMAATEASAWLVYKQAKEVVFGAVMPPFMLGGILVSLAAAIVGPAPTRFAVATALLVLAMAVTVVVHLPLNKRFTAWTVDAMPPDWSDDRRRWRVWNWGRTATVLLAFAALVL